MNWMQWIVLILIVCSFGIGIYYYDAMPAEMVSHWDAYGEPNGYMSKDMGLFLMPVVLVILVGIFYLIPRIDPLKANIEKFRTYYDGFIVVFVFFMAYMQFVSVAWNLGYQIEVGRMMAPALGILFIYVGLLCGRAKQNWFIGVRTPWTLSSTRVWNRTHQFAKNIFILMGLIWIVVGILFPQYAIYLVWVLLLGVLGLIVDSYLEFQKEVKDQKPIATDVGKASVELKLVNKKEAKKSAKKPAKKPAKKKAQTKKSTKRATKAPKKKSAAKKKTAKAKVSPKKK